MNRTAGLATLLGVALLALGGQARADSETFTATFSPISVDFSTDSSVPQFNPSLGTLTGVVMSMVDGSSMSGTLTNLAGHVQTFTVSEGLEMALTSSSDPDIDLDNTVSASQHYYQLASGATATFGAFNPTGSVVPQALISGLNPYIGTSTVALNLTTMSTQTVTGGGGSLSLDPLAYGTVTVQYNFNAVPEPDSLTMMGLGLVGLIAIRRHRLGRSKGT